MEDYLKKDGVYVEPILSLQHRAHCYEAISEILEGGCD